MKKTSLKILILSLIFCALSAEIAAQTCTPLPSGAVSWYRAENNPFDSQGGNHGTLQGGAGFAAGNVGQAFSFNGTNGFVSVPSSAANSVTGSFTIEAWVRLNAYPTEFAPIVSKWNDITTNNRSYFLAVDSLGRLSIFVSYNNGDFGSMSASLPVPLNQFTHVAGVFDLSAQTARLYINGVERASSGGFSHPLAVNNEPLLIGAGDLGGNARDFTNGLIDEAALYNRALSASEISAIFNAGTAGKCVTATAASVSVGGRVTTADGRGIAKARVSLTDAKGETRAALTNSFGYFRLADVRAGETYVFSVSAKRYMFSRPAQARQILEDTDDINFEADN